MRRDKVDQGDNHKRNGGEKGRGETKQAKDQEKKTKSHMINNLMRCSPIILQNIVVLGSGR